MDAMSAPALSLLPNSGAPPPRIAAVQAQSFGAAWNVASSPSSLLGLLADVPTFGNYAAQSSFRPGHKLPLGLQGRRRAHNWGPRFSGNTESIAFSEEAVSSTNADLSTTDSLGFTEESVTEVESSPNGAAKDAFLEDDSRRESDPRSEEAGPTVEEAKQSDAMEVGDTVGSRQPDNGDEDILIECRNVYKSFGEKQILRGASFKIRNGEAVGIIGPSGTGKSTVLRIMAGLLAPDKGEVYICGKLRHGLISDEELSGLRIGLVFQSAALFDSLTVRENVGFMLYEHSNLSDERIAELVTESLAAVGLKNVEDRYPAELSGGMKKRVALARAIISDNQETENHEPEVVMYDEPTAGLDPIASTVVEDLIRSMHTKGNDARGKPGKIASYVVVTHQHSTIRRAVDRLLFLHEGRVVWEGQTSEFDHTTNPTVRQFADGSLDGPIRY